MNRRGSQCAIQAVRPIEVADVENEEETKEEEEEEEETRGQEPLEVNMHDKKGRGEGEGGRRRDEEEPQRWRPAGGARGRMRSIGDPRLPTKAEIREHNVTHVPY